MLQLLPRFHIGCEVRRVCDEAGGVEKCVYLTTEGKVVCQHGTTASNLSMTRCNGTLCPCKSTEGMHPLRSVCGKRTLPSKTPSMRGSLYEFLVDRKEETISDCVDGRLVRVPHMVGPVFLSKKKKLSCRHGWKWTTVWRRPVDGSACECRLKKPPRRLAKLLR